jgi:hypothetical protein
MPSFIKPRPLIDESSAEFIFTTVAWVLKNFDQDEFFKRTRLIAPNNDFFPGRVSSVEEKAANIFQHTLHYTGLRHWPFELRSMIERETNSQCQIEPAAQDELALIYRNSHYGEQKGGEDQEVPVIMTSQPLFVFFNPQQTLKPEDLSASYAHVIAQHMMIQSKQPPPGGNQCFAEASEVLASMMGFGVLLTNSAYTFRGGCGSCYNAMANRQPALTEIDNVFVLALFCHLKGIAVSDATRHLKKHLRSNYKQALKQIEQRLERVNELKSITE